MPVDRPTFSETWYRVADLHPHLRSTVQSYRQHYRGQMWHVLRDPSNNQFFRLNEAAYHFVGLLDGRRPVDQVWEACNEQLGDEAPTQQEAIQLLGQLYASNLLAADLPADASGMFDRYKKRVRREIGGYFQNFLFIRIPLIDPDAFLDRWVKLFGLAFHKLAFIPWIILIGIGIASVVGRGGDLLEAGRSENVLNPDNLMWLYLAMALIKGFHEFGHGFACKKFGVDAQSGGEVHTMGIMFLVLMPVPYVDASSSWALRNKWQRIMVSSAGMYVELAIAAVAAVIWSRTSPGSLPHTLCFNVMFIASVSTLLFNGNPLLRYDAYYILADILEIANLSQRSKEYIYYLVKRYVYGVRKPRNPAHSAGERFWLVFYGLASSVYRVFICVGIILFVADKLFFVGSILAVGAVFAWVLMPIGKWIHYLAVNPELLRTRPRAVLSTLGFVGLLVTAFGFISFDDHARAEGVVEAREHRVVFMGVDGYLVEALPSESQVAPGGEALLVARNVELQRELEMLQAERRLVQHQLDASSMQEVALRQNLKEVLQTVMDQIARAEEKQSYLRVHAPMAGTWVAPDIEHLEGAFLRRGHPVGEVIDFDDLIIRSTAAQELGPYLRDLSDREQLLDVDVRVKGRPDIRFSGRIEQVFAGQRELPHPALGMGAGGPMMIDMSDPSGVRTPENFFEVRIGSLVNAEGAVPPIQTRQRVVVRFTLGTRPLALQWWRQIRQLVQRRFHTAI